MMGSLGTWSLFVILYQTIFCVMISWSVLDCRLTPDNDELHEVTLMKFIYLYDPKACGRVYFYNITSVSENRVYSNVVWPLKNKIAAAFRTKIQLWLCLHLFWLLFAIINVTQGQRPCSFYATLLPFTLIGTALLVVDLVHAVVFLIDAKYTATESAIIAYVSQYGHLRVMNDRPLVARRTHHTDTTWVSMLLAFTSIRGIVQWIVNYWLVKDNYFEGLNGYRVRQIHMKPKDKFRKNSRLANT